MIELERVKKTLKANKLELMTKFGIKSIAIFGSYVRGENKKGSDLDILVDFKSKSVPGFLGFIELEQHLSELLGRNVDLFTKEGLKPRFRNQVIAEAVKI